MFDAVHLIRQQKFDSLDLVLLLAFILFAVVR